MKKGNLLLAQSGGTTAVINASAVGVIRQAIQSKAFDKVLCAHFGMNGILKEDFFDVSSLTDSQLDLLAKTPASAFGSCRYKLPNPCDNAEIYSNILEILQRHNIVCLAYNGGNDSMDTCNKIAEYLAKTHYPCNVIGVPKTVDNDLVGTHYCPGYGSASKYIATTIEEIALDTAVYEKGRITVCEIMGRDTGWLTAACSVACKAERGPDLIFLPEREFDVDKFLTQSEQVYRKKGHCLVAVAEGVKNANGYIGADEKLDSFNHVQLGGAANKLCSLVSLKLGISTRAIDLSLPQRAAAHILSLRDQQDAMLCGKHAVELALRDKSGVMAAITFADGKTVCNDIPLRQAANSVKSVPSEYISRDGAHILPEFCDYVLPLVEGEVQLEYEYGIPRYFDNTKLKKFI